VSALRVFVQRGDGVVVFTARPRVPRPGELVRFYLEFGPPKGGEMAPDPGNLYRLEEGRAYIYHMDRGKAPVSEVRRLHETDQPGTYGFSKLIALEGAYRVFFEAVFADGRELRVGFDCVTFGALPQDDHHDSGQTLHDAHDQGHGDHAHPPGPDSLAGDLPMAAQHQTMREMGRHWLDLGRLLDRDRWSFAEREEAMKDVGAVLRWSANMPRFKLHKFQGETDEFVRLHRELKGELSGLEGLIPGSEPREIRDAFRRIEATSCTKCHLKFRWGVAADLSRFPDLSGQP